MLHRRSLPLLAAALLLSPWLAACHRDSMPDSSPPAGEPPPPSSVQVVAGRNTASPASSAPSAPSAPSMPTSLPAASGAPPAGVASGSTAAGASGASAASGSAEPAAEAPPHKVDMLNRAKPPLQSDDLTARARKLFEAVKADNPEIARDMFFPREPFIPLKDIKNAGGYWDQLYRAYEADIHQLHRKRRKELEGAEFVSFELGSPPTWVKPGDEGNKIGYFRTFNGKLRYTADGKPRTIELKVIISWDERWYITHLLPFKH